MLELAFLLSASTFSQDPTLSPWKQQRRYRPDDIRLLERKKEKDKDDWRLPTKDEVLDKAIDQLTEPSPDGLSYLREKYEERKYKPKPNYRPLPIYNPTPTYKPIFDPKPSLGSRFMGWLKGFFKKPPKITRIK